MPIIDRTTSNVMQSGAGVQRSGTPAESKHPYSGTPAVGRESALRSKGRDHTNL